MKNIALLKTKMISTIVLIIMIILANVVSDRFYILVLLSALVVAFAFLMPMFNNSLTVRMENLKKASGGDIFTDQNEE